VELNIASWRVGACSDTLSQTRRHFLTFGDPLLHLPYPMPSPMPSPHACLMDYLPYPLRRVGFPSRRRRRRVACHHRGMSGKRPEAAQSNARMQADATRCTAREHDATRGNAMQREASRSTARQRAATQGDGIDTMTVIPSTKALNPKSCSKTNKP
jgi:hypothetical protein